MIPIQILEIDIMFMMLMTGLNLSIKSIGWVEKRGKMIEGKMNLHGRSESHAITFTEESVRRYLFVCLPVPVCLHSFFDGSRV